MTSPFSKYLLRVNHVGHSTSASRSTVYTLLEFDNHEAYMDTTANWKHKWQLSRPEGCVITER